MSDTSQDLSPLKRALVAIKDLRARLDSAERAAHEPIAIVGIGCRFPGAVESVEDYWALLRDGTDAIGPVPAARWEGATYYDPDPDAPGKTSMHSGGFLSGPIDGFDAPFFNIAPREAIRMDPQQRLLLEVSWEALENAGIAPSGLVGTDAGVFVGLSTSDYKELQQRHDDGRKIDAYVGTGGAACVAAGRISYFLGLHGPAMAVDTACSSSLVAIDLAVQALRSGRCPVAIAGGVNLMLAPEAAIYLSKVRALGADGRCKAFDAAADGYGRGEGCGVIILKRLSDAVSAGDRIVAVIRGSAVNHDGRSSGLTVPNGAAQQTVVQAALANARLDPSDVAYVEAHGTGTPLGDPIELRALGAVLGANRAEDRRLLVGTAKTNIGHLEAAAGIAGVIKVALSLAHGWIPPSLHLRTPSPHIPWAELPIDVPVTGQPWPDGARHLAGVSSFGFSGTNAHVILEAAPGAAQAEGAVDAARERPRHVLPLSARTPEALDRLAGLYARVLVDGGPVADICFTAGAGRSHFDERLAVTGGSREDLLTGLRAFRESGAQGPVKRGRAPARPPKIAFLFTGQGSQYLGMGKSLYDTQPAFRAAIDECQRLLADELEVPLLDVMHGADGGDAARLTETRYTQPALFALEYSLAQLWISWGIEPAAVIGHSVGEYAAACVAGVLTLPDALRLVAARGRLMQSLPAGGSMAAVFADPRVVADAVAPDGSSVSIAAINGPSHMVVSGPADEVGRVVDRARIAGARAEMLNVSHAFHSSLMDPILDEFERVAESVSYGAPRLRFISNLSGAPATGAVTTAQYWREHLRQPVRFADGVRSLTALGFDLFVEVGPQPVLCSLGSACVPTGTGTWLPSLRRGREDWTQLLDTVAELYVRGAALDWRGFDSDYGRRPVSLPTYPFEREPYWIDTAKPVSIDARPTRAPARLAGDRLRSAVSSDIVFQAEISTDTVPWLADHVIYGNVIFPAAGLIELALSAAGAAFPGTPRRLDQFTVREALLVPEGETRLVQTALSAVQGGSTRVTVYSAPAGDDTPVWTVHASCDVRLGDAPAALPGPPSLEDVRARAGAAESADTFYARLEAAGIQYGPSFRGVHQLWTGSREALGGISTLASASASAPGEFVIHPALLDTCFQILGAACAASGVSDEVFLPVGIESLQVIAPPGDDPIWGYAVLREQAPGNTQTLTADLWWVNGRGEPLLQIQGFTAKRASRNALQRAGRRDLDRWLHEIDWQPAPLAADATAHRPAPQHWIVLGDRIGPGPELVATLRSQGQDCVLVTAGDGDGFSSVDTELVVSPTSRAGFQQMLRTLLPATDRPCGIVHLWAVSDGPARENLCASVLALAQAVTVSHGHVPRLWLVTRGAQPVDSSHDVDPAQTALWGLGQVVAAELPSQGCVRVDLDPTAPGQIAQLARELREGHAEDQIAFRGDQRFAARLVPIGAPSARPRLTPPAGDRWQLAVHQRGSIDHLTFATAERRTPAPGEIEVRVHGTGLNFRDVLNVLGMYPGDPGPLGGECSGRVVAVGDGVTEFEPGDDVMCMGGGSFTPYFTVSTGLVMPKPACLTHEQAAGVPIAFLTALYGLTYLGGMKAGDRVLIHAAAGGVGMAAVQLALRAGAEVFGTAGSAAKRRVLAQMGVQHVLNSRTLDFADEILAATGRRGVDIVLNSLTGDFITRSLSVLAPGGRFLEIGKADIRTAEQVAAINPHVSYAVFDLGEVVLRDRVLAARLYANLLAGLSDGSLQPLPLRVFPIDDAPSAFRFMAQARHIGKVVVSQPGARRGDWEAQGAIFRDDATYLVTGGLGALGLSAAAWMADRGARHIVLAGRSDPSPSATAEIAAIEKGGAAVQVIAADISAERDVRRLLDAATAERPLRGIVHAAGVLHDGMLGDQRWEDFAGVLAPKMMGASLLDRLTRSHPVDHFILFSSVASVLGSAGQGAYAAANAFLDGLAHHRRSVGLPAVSINWGPWADRGMASALSSRDRQRMSDTGFEMIPTADGLAALERVVGLGRAQVAVMPVRWAQVCARFAGGTLPPLFRIVGTPSVQAGAVAGPARVTLRPQLDAAPDSEKKGLVVAFVRNQVAKALALTSPSSLGLRTPFTDLGLDSLMAVELRNALSEGTGLELRASLVYDCPCIEDLAEYLGVALLGTVSAPDAGAEPAGTWHPATDDLDDLSEQELAGLLSAGMASLRREER